VVKGVTYTQHAVQRMLPVGMGGRGIPPSVVENTITHGSKAVGNKPDSIVHTFDNVIVVTNEALNKVITVFTTGR